MPTPHPDRLFPADANTRAIARELYAGVHHLPLVSPHGHVDPALLADDARLPDPLALLVTPDHYVTRMLYSQGIPLDRLGVPHRPAPGARGPAAPAPGARGPNSPASGAQDTDTPGDGGGFDPREAWRTFCAHWYLFRGTPSRLWLEQVLADLFEVTEPLSARTADATYEQIDAHLKRPEYRPRALFERFGLEVLTTTDSPLSTLDQHARLAAEGWGTRVIPAFRPDDVVDPQYDGWASNVARLGELTGEDTATLDGYLSALRQRRAAFAKAGATSTDHGHPTARTLDLPREEATRLFDRLLRAAGTPDGVDGEDAEAFRAYMLVRFAGMSVDDGLVMQLHPGAARNHNRLLHRRYGRDVGGDVPSRTDYVEALRPLLDRHGDDPRLRLVLFTLDESTYARELAPLAGVYPAVYLGPAWWFFDSPEGMRRYRELTTETAGFYNTVGFTDDTRAFCSIPTRHDVARRVDCAYLARLVAEHRLPLDEAAQVAADLAYHLPRQVYRLDGTPTGSPTTGVQATGSPATGTPTGSPGTGSPAASTTNPTATPTSSTGSTAAPTAPAATSTA